MNRGDVVTEARTWIGTPFHHQGRKKGVGVDCGGLVGAVAMDVGLLPSNFWRCAFAPFAGYARTPANEALRGICERFMDSTTDPQPGDILLMRFASEPQHLAIVAPYLHGGLSIIHAYSRADRVIEHRYADVWIARTVAAYSFRGIECQAN